MTPPQVVILAAGQGTRMRSAVPKVLHPVCGRPMILWPVEAARSAGVGKVVVVGGPDRAAEPILPDGVRLAVQAEPHGTADAVAAAAPEIGRDATVVVLMGDVPLVTPATIASLVSAHEQARAAATLLSMELDDPGAYGRVVRDPEGSVERVVEARAPGDANSAELAIREVNTGIYAFAGGELLDALAQVRPDNAQRELYLPDVVPILRSTGRPVHALRVDDPTLLLGVNDRVELATVVELAQRRLHEQHARAGVTVVAPGATVIEADVTIGSDTVIEPSSFLRGATRVGARCRVGPLTTLIDAVLGDEVAVPHSYLAGCEVRAGGIVGPFAYLRPDALVREGAKVGTFVEVKNSDVGPGAKIPHLSYVGDTDVGEGANLGAGTITANYDGRRKHRTRIGARVRGGVGTAFVAPVDVGDDAYTAAGSVIVEDVPAGALGVARERQRNVEGYAARVAAEKEPG